MYKHILLPIDLGQPQASDKALKSARQIARDYGAVLHVMNVVAPLDSLTSSLFPRNYTRKMTDTAQARLHEYTEAADLEGMDVQHIIAHGAIYDQILAMAKQTKADLIVMASHRPELSDYLLGPNAAKVVRHARCSVMVVRD